VELLIPAVELVIGGADGGATSRGRSCTRVRPRSEIPSHVSSCDIKSRKASTAVGEKQIVLRVDVEPLGAYAASSNIHLYETGKLDQIKLFKCRSGAPAHLGVAELTTAGGKVESPDSGHSR
jgi:hypothetical protein